MKFLTLSTLICILSLFYGVSSALALTASPVKIEVQGDPGQTLRGEIELLNEQDDQKILFSSFENFEPAGDTGSPRFIGAKDGLATWLQTEPSVTIDPGKKARIPYSITIPANAEPGGYFAAIFFGAQDPKTQQGGEVSIGGKLGVLLLLRVSGDIVENAGLSLFQIEKGARLVSSLPISFTYTFSNSGGDRVVPLGDIKIKNTFGLLTTSIPANINEGSVLPNSSRKFHSTWGEVSTSTTTMSFFQTAKKQFENFHFGVYSANISVVYGSTNQVASDTFYFLLIPWQLLSLCIILCILIYIGLRKYNAWIISKSKSTP